MRARATVRAEVGPGGATRLAGLRSEVPLVLRPAAGALYLAAGAGGPLGGDDLELCVQVGPGAALTLRTVGATVALPGPGESVLTLRLDVAAGGRLAVLPEPTVVADRARHRTVVEATVAAGGVLLLREEVLLGRHGEAGGAYRGLLRVDLDGAPLLRHELVLDGADPVSSGPVAVTGGRACGALLAVGTELPAAEPDLSFAVLPLAAGGYLATALAADAPSLRSRLDGLLQPA
jgi:urease accessory protein